LKPNAATTSTAATAAIAEILIYHACQKYVSILQTTVIEEEVESKLLSIVIVIYPLSLIQRLKISQTRLQYIRYLATALTRWS
jgi:hypothetical protein